jgi:transcriptional regulator with XRE-family HTH domain
MTVESDRPLNQRLKAARREKRMSQSDVAQTVGCKQSAVSMFENGKTVALADDKVAAICELLEVPLPVAPAAPTRPATTVAATTFCPTYDCPSNLPYMVGGELRLLPEARSARLEIQPHCRYCGEHLESQCPDCGSPASGGACCLSCGSAYVHAPELGEEASGWVQTQQQRVMLIRPGATS